ncbi:MAG TPA: YtxH domain-containing protein [Ferruginibacter sp.]|nr:YtxH domain-containing protein [Ferruginibacter sp.]
MKNPGSTGIFGKLLLGTLIGGAVSMLFTPGKRNKTRKKIPLKGGKLGDIMRSRFDAFIKNTGQDAKDLKPDARRFINTGNARSNNLKVVR